MTMNEALHPRDETERLYVSRKERGIKLESIENSVDTSIRRFEDGIKTAKKE